MSADLEVGGEVIFDPLSEEYFSGAANVYRRLREDRKSTRLKSSH